MSKYTTGELAKLCEVSVRTVQFYDSKNLLKPTELTEGGRRLYSDDDLNKLRLICTLKSLGLSLDSIKGILESENPSKILLLLLDEQLKLIDREIEDRRNQVKSIEFIKDTIRSMDTISVNSISGIKQIMNNKKKLRKTHVKMLIIGIIMSAIQIAGIALWIINGNWIPFAAAMPFVILMGILTVKMYHRNTNYICPQCDTKFKARFREFFFAGHTPKTRKLTCPNCGIKGYCVEIASED